MPLTLIDLRKNIVNTRTQYLYVIQNIKDERKIYVGITNNFNKRRSHHQNNIFNKKSKLYSSMKKHGIENFKMIILEDFNTRKDVSSAEVFMIALLKQLNYKLLNVSSGGENNYVFTIEHCQKISKSNIGRKNSPESIEKAAAKRRGTKNSEESKIKTSNALKGRIFSDETKKKISMACSGLKKPEGFGKKISQIMTGRPGTGRKLSTKDILNIRSNKNNNKIPELALIYNCSKSTIVNVIKYKTYKDVK